MLALKLFSSKDVAGKVERVTARDIGEPKFSEPDGERFHGEADRRQARTAFSLPILRVSVISGVSLS